MNAHSIGVQHPGAAPQEEMDRHLHNQPTADVSGTTPAPTSPSSNAAITQGVQTSGQITGASENQSPHTPTQLDSDARASQQQQSRSAALPSSQYHAPSSTQFDQVQGNHRSPVPAVSSAALQLPQPALEAIIDGSSHSSASQLQPAAGAANAQGGNSPLQQAQPDQEHWAGSSHSSEGHASFQHNNDLARQTHGQSPEPTVEYAVGPGPVSQQSAESGHSSEVHASYQHKDYVPSQTHGHSASLSVDSAAGPSQPSGIHASYQLKDYVPSDTQNLPQSSASAAQAHQERLDEAASQQSAPLSAVVDQSQKSASDQAEAQSSSAQGHSLGAPSGASLPGHAGLAVQTGDQAISQQLASANDAGQAAAAAKQSDAAGEAAPDAAQQSAASMEAGTLPAAGSSSAQPADESVSGRGAGTPAGPLGESWRSPGCWFALCTSYLLACPSETFAVEHPPQ